MNFELNKKGTAKSAFSLLDISKNDLKFDNVSTNLKFYRKLDGSIIRETNRIFTGLNIENAKVVNKVKITSSQKQVAGRRKEAIENKYASNVDKSLNKDEYIKSIYTTFVEYGYNKEFEKFKVDHLNFKNDFQYKKLIQTAKLICKINQTDFSSLKNKIQTDSF